MKLYASTTSKDEAIRVAIAEGKSTSIGQHVVLDVGNPLALASLIDTLGFLNFEHESIRH